MTVDFIVRKLADMVGISKSAVNRILTENLDLRKLCARWVPRLLTKKKDCIVRMFQSCVWRCFTAIKLIFCIDFITMDETWVHHTTPETKEQSKQWTEMGESALKKAKTAQSAGKVMTSVFWDYVG